MHSPQPHTSSPASSLKIALVHDYLREYGGAERVLEALHELFPEAPVYTAFVDEAALGDHWPRFSSWDLRQTWITRLPLYKKWYSPYRVFAAHAFADLDLSEFDVVISSSNAYFAKAVRVPNGRHICYCHTPPRSLYGYTTLSNWRANPITHFVGTLINHYTRVIDFRVAQRVDVFIANSRETQRRITKFYRRDSTIIHPPVDLPQLTKSQLAAPLGKYYLYVNRLALAKHPELAVAACTQHNLPLKVVGSGQMLPQLRELAGPSVEFLGSVPDDQLHQLYLDAKALLYPVEDEDFGIVPVEAMARGIPVIAHRSGGPQETIIDGLTGVFFDELTEAGLSAAMTQAAKLDWQRAKIAKQAQQFGKARFLKEVVATVSLAPTPQTPQS